MYVAVILCLFVSCVKTAERISSHDLDLLGSRDRRRHVRIVRFPIGSQYDPTMTSHNGY